MTERGRVVAACRSVGVAGIGFAVAVACRVGVVHRRAEPHDGRPRPLHPGDGAGPRRAARVAAARRADHDADGGGDGRRARRGRRDDRRPGRRQRRRRRAVAAHGVLVRGRDRDQPPSPRRVDGAGDLRSRRCSSSCSSSRSPTWSAVPGDDLLALAALGVGQIGLGLVFLTIGARLIPAAQVALITLLEVVLGPLWVWLAVDERPSTRDARRRRDRRRGGDHPGARERAAAPPRGGGGPGALMAARRGIYLAPFDELADPRRVARLAARAEERGWDGFFVWDHIVYSPAGPRVRRPVGDAERGRVRHGARADRPDGHAAVAAPRPEAHARGGHARPPERRAARARARPRRPAPRRARAVRRGRGPARGRREMLDDGARAPDRVLGGRVRAAPRPAAAHPDLARGALAAPPSDPARRALGRRVPDRPPRSRGGRRARRGRRGAARPGRRPVRGRRDPPGRTRTPRRGRRRARPGASPASARRRARTRSARRSTPARRPPGFGLRPRPGRVRPPRGPVAGTSADTGWPYGTRRGAPRRWSASTAPPASASAFLSRN